MKEQSLKRMLKTPLLLINFALIVTPFSCSPGKPGGTTNTIDTPQIETVKKYVEPARPKTAARDTVIIECLQKDCSEEITKYYIKGNLNGETYSRENGKFRIQKTYYVNNGPLAHVDTLIDSKQVGASVIYYPNGQLQRITRRDKNGIEIGPYQSYYEDGQQKLTIRFVKGKRHGEMVEYHPNGNVMQRGEFKNDQRHGVWRTFDVNGYLKEEKNYDNGIELK